MEIIAYGRFTKEMNLFSATFELVLSERRTSSQQAENLFKISRDALLSLRGLGHGRVALLRDRWEWGMDRFVPVAQERDPPMGLVWGMGRSAAVAQERDPPPFAGAQPTGIVKTSSVPRPITDLMSSLPPNSAIRRCIPDNP